MHAMGVIRDIQSQVRELISCKYTTALPVYILKHESEVTCNYGNLFYHLLVRRGGYKVERSSSDIDYDLVDRNRGTRRGSTGLSWALVHQQI